jgi:hypothetical protein
LTHISPRVDSWYQIGLRQRDASGTTVIPDIGSCGDEITRHTAHHGRKPNSGGRLVLQQAMIINAIVLAVVLEADVGPHRKISKFAQS